MSPRRVIINADDFGWSEGVTEGILQAHVEGVVTSTTIVANMPLAAQALRRLKDVAPRDLGVGVHLNLSQGPPLSEPGRAFAGSDGLMNDTAMRTVVRLATQPWLLAAAEAELAAQIEWVLDHGLVPTHLDSHRHCHAFTPLLLRVAKLARRYGIGYLRWHGERLPGRDWPRGPAKQRRNRTMLNLFGLVNRRLASDLRATTGTWGVEHTGRIDAAWLIRAVETLPPGITEIMTHPGLGEALDPGGTRLVESRQTELDALRDPAVRAAFDRHNVERTHYGKLTSNA